MPNNENRDPLIKSMLQKIEKLTYAQLMGKKIEAARYREEAHSLMDILMDNQIEITMGAIKNS